MRYQHFFCTLSAIALAAHPGTPLMAQQASSHGPTPQANVSQDGNSNSDAPVPAAGMTAAGYLGAYDLLRDSVHGLHLARNGHVVMNRDSVKTIVDSMARHWITELERAPTPQFQQVPMAALYARIGNDAEATQRVAAMLAKPGITVAERVWILHAAVRFLLQTEDLPTPARIQQARKYLAQMEAVSAADNAIDRFESAMMIMAASARIGDVKQGLQDGWHAYDMFNHVSDYETRALMATNENFIRFALLLSASPTGHTTIDSLVTMLQNAVALPPALAAKDTALRRYEAGRRVDLEKLTKKVAFFGRPAAPFVATNWYNQPLPAQTSDVIPNARVRALNDGEIRIIAMGFFGCPWCERAMAQFERLRPRLPKGVDLVYYTYTDGNWDGDLVEPQEEAEHLRHYYLERKHFTFPIVIWASPKEPTPEGGMLPRRSPMLDAYAFNAGPTIIVVDGHGVVRHYQEGLQNYDTDLKTTIDQLVQERDHGSYSSR